MVTYSYYQTGYMGSRIPEKAFSEMEARAEQALARFERCYIVCGGEDSRRMAVCAMAEALYDASRNRGLSSATVGSVAVRYADGKTADRQLWRELYRRASIYLDIYRGCSL